jgi:hypothetical protein
MFCLPVQAQTTAGLHSSRADPARLKPVEAVRTRKYPEALRRSV